MSHTYQQNLNGSAVRRPRGCAMFILPAVVVLLLFGGTVCFMLGAVFRWPANAGMLVLQVFSGVAVVSLAAMTAWSFFAVVTTDPGSPENEQWMELPSYRNRPIEEPRVGQEAAAAATPRMREERVVRYCRHCNAHKPDRAHHCRQLGRCVLRMDHACPWVGNTIGWRNHKFFVLFCSWCGAVCVMALALGLASLGLRTGFDIVRWDAYDALVAVWCFFGGVFGLTLVGFGGFHVALMMKNQTTLEQMKHDNRWDLGSKTANVEELLGAKRWTYVLPLAPHVVGSGLEFGRWRAEEP